MIKHFYAADHANQAQTLTAFTKKSARDKFVERGSRRFAKTRVEADTISRKQYKCNAKESVNKGFIGNDTNTDTSHGSAYDLGRMDAFYGRKERLDMIDNSDYLLGYENDSFEETLYAPIS
jgi:hypothetical protein